MVICSMYMCVCCILRCCVSVEFFYVMVDDFVCMCMICVLNICIVFVMCVCVCVCVCVYICYGLNNTYKCLKI